MTKVDYIVVGLGIAGLSFCEQLKRNNKTFLVYDLGASNSTKVSGGVFNPVVLKRFTRAWKAHEYTPYASAFYESLSQRFGSSIFSKIPIYRILKSVEEQNNWMIACDKNELSPFLSPELINNNYEYVDAPFGYGVVKGSAKIHPDKLLQAYGNELDLHDQLVEEKFDYRLLKEKNDEISYKSIIAKRIIFSEGSAALDNPYFPKKALIRNKGEYLIINSEELKLDVILKGSLFIIPMEPTYFKVGATYSRDDCSLLTTSTAASEITDKLNKILRCEYKVVDQIAGIRPTTKDRRPLIGKLSTTSNMAFLNGLGTRGIMMAPSLGKMLYDHLEEGVPLEDELKISRVN